MDSFVATRQDGVDVIGKDDGYFVLVGHGAERNDVAIQSRMTWMASLRLAKTVLVL